MRIVIDLDGVICKIKKDNQTYDELNPVPGAAKRIKDLRSKGHYIIISTSRHMKTCDGNVGKIMKRVGKITLDWLARYDIEYDEIYFGKPNGEIYIDDRAIRFSNWQKITDDTITKNARKR